MNDQEWHLLPLSEVLLRFGNKIDGLSSKEAEDLLHKYGKNELPQKDAENPWSAFFRQMNNPLMAILGAATLLKLFMRQFGNAVAIFFVIVFNSLLGFFQERKAEKSLEAIRKLTTIPAKVFRNKELHEIAAKELVPGDLLFLESGARICADARLVESHALEIDESMLTGESLPVIKNAHAILSRKTPVFEQKNMVFSGSTVVRGRAKAVVVATGISTKFAAIAKSSEEATPPSSPLQERLSKFGTQLTLIILLLMAFIIAIGVWQGTPLLDLVMTCVSLSVAAIPEGLPMAVTITLSLGLLRMSQKNAVVRKLPAIETLGCTTVICTDKTGTLTKNQMTPSEIFIGGKLETISTNTTITSTPALLWAGRICYFCSETTLKEDDGFVGDPIDAALMRFSMNNIPLDTSCWKNELTLPFEPELRMMSSQIQGKNGSYSLYKGALETLSPLCSKMWIENQIVDYDEAVLYDAAAFMASRGLRVIALAYKDIASPSLTMVGLIGLFDPPREEAIAAISTCQKAHIRVIMATGDHPETAAAVAHQVGIPTNFLVTGDEISEMNDNALLETVSKTSVFARVSPQDKLRIVQQLQRRNEVVAMTGDGVNDAPPLRQADIGIAMGSGTEIAKEASAMVVLDDNFATIVEAIRQGRIIFKSLQQLAVYLLTTCFGSVMTIGASVLLSFPLPLLPLQLLWINLVTDGTNTIPLAMEGEHGNSMLNPPRGKLSPFLYPRMYVRALLASGTMMIGTISIFAWSLGGYDLKTSRTMAFTVLALFQMLHALNSRSVRRSLFFSLGNSLERIPFLQNKWLLLTLSLCAGLQVAAVEWPPLQEILETTSLSLYLWARLLLVAFSVIIVVELHKIAVHKAKGLQH